MDSIKSKNPETSTKIGYKNVSVLNGVWKETWVATSVFRPSYVVFMSLPTFIQQLYNLSKLVFTSRNILFFT